MSELQPELIGFTNCVAVGSPDWEEFKIDVQRRHLDIERPDVHESDQPIEPDYQDDFLVRTLLGTMRLQQPTTPLIICDLAHPTEITLQWRLGDDGVRYDPIYVLPLCVVHAVGVYRMLVALHSQDGYDAVVVWPLGRPVTLPPPPSGVTQHAFEKWYKADIGHAHISALTLTSTVECFTDKYAELIDALSHADELNPPLLLDYYEGVLEESSFSDELPALLERWRDVGDEFTIADFFDADTDLAVHDPQVKLFFSHVLAFLYASFAGAEHIVYAGSSPGWTLPPIISHFRDSFTSIHLFDPRRHCDAIQALALEEHVEGVADVYVYEACYQQRDLACDVPRNSAFFISDIMSDDFTSYQSAQFSDAHLAQLRPRAALLKANFWDEEETTSTRPAAIKFVQPGISDTSTEVRLLVASVDQLCTQLVYNHNQHAKALNKHQAIRNVHGELAVVSMYLDLFSTFVSFNDDALVDWLVRMYRESKQWTV